MIGKFKCAGAVAAAEACRGIVALMQRDEFAAFVDAIGRKEIVRQMRPRSIRVMWVMADAVVAADVIFQIPPAKNDTVLPHLMTARLMMQFILETEFGYAATANYFHLFVSVVAYAG
jgi:hypothetical protein